MEALDVATFRQALSEVAERLQRRGIHARMYLVGGAAMAFAYDATRLTRDLDGLVTLGHGPLMEEARELARRPHGSTSRCPRSCRQRRASTLGRSSIIQR